MNRYKQKYYDNKERGLCVRCGKSEPRLGGTKCQSCSDYQSETGKAIRARRKAAKLCVTCGKKPYRYKRVVEHVLIRKTNEETHHEYQNLQKFMEITEVDAVVVVKQTYCF